MLYNLCKMAIKYLHALATTATTEPPTKPSRSRLPSDVPARVAARAATDVARPSASPSGPRCAPRPHCVRPPVLASSGMGRERSPFESARSPLAGRAFGYGGSSGVLVAPHLPALALWCSGTLARARGLHRKGASALPDLGTSRATQPLDWCVPPLSVQPARAGGRHPPPASGFMPRAPAAGADHL
jgi:hypothetical protein